LVALSLKVQQPLLQQLQQSVLAAVSNS